MFWTLDYHSSSPNLLIYFLRTSLSLFSPSLSLCTFLFLLRHQFLFYHSFTRCRFPGEDWTRMTTMLEESVVMQGTMLVQHLGEGTVLRPQSPRGQLPAPAFSASQHHWLRILIQYNAELYHFEWEPQRPGILFSITVLSLTKRLQSDYWELPQRLLSGSQVFYEVSEGSAAP